MQVEVITENGSVYLLDFEKKSYSVNIVAGQLPSVAGKMLGIGPLIVGQRLTIYGPPWNSKENHPRVFETTRVKFVSYRNAHGNAIHLDSDLWEGPDNRSTKPDGLWYFWDETWAGRNGPFNSYEETKREIARYAHWLDHGVEAFAFA